VYEYCARRCSMEMSRGAAASAPAVAESPSSKPAGASMETHVLVSSDTMVWYTGKNDSGTTYFWNEAGVAQYDRPADFDESVARHEMEKLQCVVAAPPPAPPPAPPSVAPSDFDELCLKTSLRDWLSKWLDCRILDRTHEALEREEVFSVADLAMFCALPRFTECLTALTREKVLNALKDEGLISSAAPAPPSPPGPGDSTPDWLAEASARASWRRDVEAEVATELRCRAAEMASELEHAQGAVSSTISLAEHAQAASRHATTQRPATAPVTARETGYYITVTGGGACYHLTPMCSGLRQAGVMRVASTGGRRLCNICAGVNAKPLICAGVNAKPLIRAPSTALMSARHVYYTSTTGHQRSSAVISGHLPRPLVARLVYYTTRTGKKYHTDRCCSGLRNAATIFEVTSRPELDACILCCRR